MYTTTTWTPQGNRRRRLAAVLLASIGVALAVAPAWGQGDCAEGFECYSVPGYISWQELQQPAADLTVYVPSISFSAVADGIAPMDTVISVAVPEAAGAGSLADLDLVTLAQYNGFVRHVARDSVFAAVDVVGADGQVAVRAGSLLLPAHADFPRRLPDIQLLRQAGVDHIRALVNLTHMMYRSRIATNLAAFSEVVKSPTIYERQIDFNAKRQLLINLFDDNPLTGFTRIDGLNRTVEKRAVVITMDLLSRFPTRMVRFYPIPRDVPFPIAGFQLEAHDGLTYKRGQELVDILQPRLGAGVSSRDYTYEEGDLPVWDVLLTTESSLRDTIRVYFPEPEYIQQYKFRSLTNMDYDIAEFEVYGEGFMPSTQYLSRPMAVRREGIPAMLAYLDGDASRRTELTQQRGGTLGRIFWDETKVGDPAKSSASVQIQTGLSPEPNILYRLNVNQDVVPWRVNAQVVDRRENSQTAGQLVNLDDPTLRASAFDIWNALSQQERAEAQTTTPEYAALAAGNKKDRSGIPLVPEPDLLYWSGFQPVVNGQIIPVPGERPFFQLKVDFDSQEPDAATMVSNLRFEHLFPPAVERVTAEIVPGSGVQGGVDTLFTYALRPTVGAADRGFDHIRVETPVEIQHVVGVEFGYGDTQNLATREAVDWSEVARETGYFVVRTPHVTASTVRQGSLVILVTFRGRVLATKSTFAGQVFLDDFGARDSTEYGSIISMHRRDPQSGALQQVHQILPQRVLAGNVLDFSAALGDRNSLDVVTRVDQAVQDVVMRAGVAPNPFTPNGDGVNDAVEITYDILRVVAPVPVTTEIFDLSGRLVRRFRSERRMGEYTERWDGTGEDGHVVPPGSYLVLVRAATDAGDFVSSRVLAVAY